MRPPVLDTAADRARATDILRAVAAATTDLAQRHGLAEETSLALLTRGGVWPVRLHGAWTPAMLQEATVTGIGMDRFCERVRAAVGAEDDAPTLTVDAFHYRTTTLSTDALQQKVTDELRAIATRAEALLALPDAPKPTRSANPPIGSPWGAVQYAYEYADGIISVGTAGHGGFRLSPERNAEVHAAWRSADGWYEEDEEWSIVAATFPAVFPLSSRALAERSLKNSRPDAYTQVYGLPVAVEDSVRLQDDAFAIANADALVVRSALRHESDPSRVRVWAARGGRPWRRDEAVSVHLVSAAEYAARPRQGFVVDPVKYPAIVEPSVERAGATPSAAPRAAAIR